MSIDPFSEFFSEDNSNINTIKTFSVKYAVVNTKTSRMDTLSQTVFKQDNTFAADFIVRNILFGLGLK
jgi:hypothetical protein